jgi:hypothetical protein
MQTKRRRNVAYGTVLASATIVALIWFLFAFPIEFSYNLHHDAEHMWNPDWFSSLLHVSYFIATICLAPALGVVFYYQKHNSDIRSLGSKSKAN